MLSIISVVDGSQPVFLLVLVSLHDHWRKLSSVIVEIIHDVEVHVVKVVGVNNISFNEWLREHAKVVIILHVRCLVVDSSCKYTTDCLQKIFFDVLLGN